MSSTLAADSPVPTSSLRQDAQLMGLIGIAHAVSHFSQLLLAPLFPWLKDQFQVSYTELGLLMSVFFVVSCVVQTVSGFLVDRWGPRPVLIAGLAMIFLAAVGYALSPSYLGLALSSVLAGIGNGVFHPVDYTLLNRRIAPHRLGHAYSVHGVTGTLGWALAPALLAPLAQIYSWRIALLVAAAVIFVVLVVLVMNYGKLAMPRAKVDAALAARKVGADNFGFLTIPAVWVCFTFFLLYAMAFAVIQLYAPEAARQLHGVPVSWSAMCLTIYMVASACGMAVGGFLASNPERCVRVVAIGFSLAAMVAIVLGVANLPVWSVPVLFAIMGFTAGTAGPSRDLIVKRSTPANASGRVYGVVYSGMDIGQAIAPAIFGGLMDTHNYSGLWVGVAVVQGLLIISAFNVVRSRREQLQPA